jgi:hypothetical protein
MPSRTIRVALSLAFILCFAVSLESGWKVFAMGKFLQFQAESPPISAEAMSSKAAPILRAATGADKLYGIVQDQHVQLRQQYELMNDLARDARSEAALSLAGAAVSMGLIWLALFMLGKSQHAR